MGQHIVEDVCDHLGDLVLVADHRDFGRNATVQSDELGLARRIPRVHVRYRVGARVSDVDHGAIERAALVQPSELKQVLHESAHSLRFRFDAAHCWLHLFVWYAPEPIKLRVSAHRC